MLMQTCCLDDGVSRVEAPQEIWSMDNRLHAAVPLPRNPANECLPNDGKLETRKVIVNTGSIPAGVIEEIHANSITLL